MKRTSFIIRIESGRLISQSICCKTLSGLMCPKDSDVYGVNGTYWHPFATNLKEESWIGDVITIKQHIPNHTVEAQYTGTIIAKRVIEYDGNTFPVSALAQTVKQSKDWQSALNALQQQYKDDQAARTMAQHKGLSQRYNQRRGAYRR